jgi:hypothetical protein
MSKKRLSVMLPYGGALLLSLLVLGWGSSSPQTALLPVAGAARHAHLHRQGQAASPHDARRLRQEIQAALSSPHPGAAAEVFTHQLVSLIRVDPWAAARFVQAHENEAWYDEFMRALAENWAEVNADEASQWVAQMERPDEQDTMLSCLCFRVAQTDPMRAIQLMEQQGVHTERRLTLLGSLAHEWATKDMASALKWAAQYPSGETRDALFRQIALARAKSSPAEAAWLVVQQIPPGPIQSETGLCILHEWARQDAPGAAAWAEQFPEGELRDRAIDDVSRIATYLAQPSPEVCPLIRE